MTTDYDALPYRSQPYALSRPEHLSIVALLRGVTAPDLATARVLEIGCAQGNNLAPLAYAYPNGSFLGIDSSERQIAAAQELATAIGLGNCEFRVQDFRNGDALDEFDYIICHGVYSWVSHDAQQQLLSLCHKALAPEGVVYISYNTNPGWHVRSVVRDALLFHTAAIEEPERRIDEAREFAEFIAENMRGLDLQNTSLAQDEFSKAARLPGWYLLHDLLEGVNDPVYLHDFLGAASGAGLMYLADSELALMAASEFSAEARKKLYKLARTPEDLEQYLDILRLRTFRRSLLIHQGREIKQGLEFTVLCEMYLRSNCEPGPPSEHGRPVKSLNGADVVIGEGPLAAALALLSERYPETVSFAELSASLDPAPQADELCQHLLQGYFKELVELYRTELPVTREPEALPRATTVARVQAKRGSEVVNLCHELVELDSFSRQVVPLCDGSRSAAEIARELQSAGTNVELNGEPIPMDEAVARSLAALARECILERRTKAEGPASITRPQSLGN